MVYIGEIHFSRTKEVKTKEKLTWSSLIGRRVRRAPTAHNVITKRVRTSSLRVTAPARVIPSPPTAAAHPDALQILQTTDTRRALGRDDAAAAPAGVGRGGRVDPHPATGPERRVGGRVSWCLRAVAVLDGVGDGARAWGLVVVVEVVADAHGDLMEEGTVLPARCGVQNGTITFSRCCIRIGVFQRDWLFLSDGWFVLILLKG